jgi:hypothetical protein
MVEDHYTQSVYFVGGQEKNDDHIALVPCLKVEPSLILESSSGHVAFLPASIR